MEGQSPAGQPQYLYQSAQWSRLIRRNTEGAESTTLSPSSLVQPPQFPPQLDALPSLLPPGQATFQVKLENYNKLLYSSGRTPRQVSSPLPPVVSAHHIQAAPRATSTVSENSKASKSTRAGHGNKKSPALGNGERPLIAKEDTSGKMSTKKYDLAKQYNPRPLVQHQTSMTSQRSESVPTTPHQHARQFSLGSRDPSPNAAPNHSPRSAYSESNSTMPSLRPMPKRIGACKYETAMAHSRRRMAYKIGTDKLEKVQQKDIKPKLTADEERKLSGDMRELYDRLLPTPQSEGKREKFVQKLEKLLNDEWPGHDIRVHMFGSSGNLLCTDESDVDICITTEWKELEGVCMLAECLAKHGMEKVICVSTAKVPIVKIWDPELGLACDMNVNNTLALENTRMIKTYVQIDDRVRPLAMIIKHWTKRRIVNDAAFGGTLSSYTWICMIINFLQTRNPIILPSLHQRPHQKLPSKDGHESAFADNLSALQSCGKDNKDTLGELLFQFFKFFAHEMDYDNQVLSVRNGKLISKVDKGWHLATNNRLCVEEPFNTVRNLGNTADDTSFKGLHMEIRRAFDLIAEGKLEEACEQYVFPKEEERIWEKPPPQPRPILSRSTSQSRGGRGGFRGGRHNNNNHARNGGNRRASSGAFDNQSSYVPHVVPQGLTPQEVWTHTQAAQERLHNDLYTTFSVLQAQENNLRLQLYNQSQAYAQAQAQAFHQAQRLQPNGSIKSQQATDRSRGSSFDNPPLTAPIRPEMYYYPLQYQATPIYGSHSPSTYPSSPSLSPAMPELRRSLHRSTVTGGSGGVNGSSNSTLRSHSQPATRSMPSPLALQGLAASNYGLNGFSGYLPQRQANGVIIPNFIADESAEAGLETESLPASSDSPPEGRPKEYLGYYLSNEATAFIQPRESVTVPPIPAFGDLPSRRRPSTDQFPQAIFDRLRRTSRSPSPLGRNRTHSASSTPSIGGPSTMSSSNLRALNNQGPLVVNGSSSLPPSQGSDRQPSVSDNSLSEETSYDPLSTSVESLRFDPAQGTPSYTQNTSTGVWHESIPVMNGSRISGVENAPITGLGISTNPNQGGPVESKNGINRLSPNRGGRQPPNGAISPLDIAFNKVDDIPHLSPIVETRTPSPTANRKFEPSLEMQESSKTQASSHPSKPALAKFALTNSTQKATLDPKPNGHTRASKSEGGNAGAWQKIPIPKGKKKSQADQKAASGKTSAEQKPVNDSERKGG